MAPDEGRLRAMPTGIWVLGLGSMLMDISSELVHSLLPLFMVGVLGASRIMRPVVHRRDAGGDCIGGGEPDGAIAVLGLHQRSEACSHRKIAEGGTVRADEDAD